MMMMPRSLPFATALSLTLWRLLVIRGGWIAVRVGAFPDTEQAKEELERARKALLFAKADGFVQGQFRDWMGAQDCSGFVSSFADPFEYCDATPACVTSQADLLRLCQKMAGMAGKVFDLQIKPNWSPLPNFTAIVATGKQNLDLGRLRGAMCFDFAIVQDLEEVSPGQLRSHSWRGYYTILPLGCGWWQNVKAVVGRAIPRGFKKRRKNPEL
jgi:hypothetical protein